MDRKNLIQRATDYFGVAYYGFLALYSLYELFFGGNYVSSIVIAPLFYVLTTLGLLYFMLSPFYLIAAVQNEYKKSLLEDARTFFLGGIVLIAAAVALTNGYLLPEDRHILFDKSSWIFALIAIVDIIHRQKLFGTLKSQEDRSLEERLEKAVFTYKEGIITAVILLGGYSLLSIAYSNPGKTDTLGFITFTSGFGLLLIIILQAINIKLGKKFKKTTSNSPHAPIAQGQRRAARKYHPLIWPIWSGTLFSLIIALLTYHSLVHLSSHTSLEHVFIAIFALNYAMLAFVRLWDTRRQSKEVMS